MPGRMICFLLLLLSATAGVVQSQQMAAPDTPGGRRELRGVWLTTLLGLDWPHASQRGSIEAQKKALREIFDDLRRNNFNAVFFQVRSRGNAMYRSTMEPWCSELTGTLGKDPGWDPLAFAIAEARERGLELHAWFNVFRIWSAGMPPASVPAHIAHAHPSWVKRYGDDLWLDPGIPEAREYTLRVMEELVRGYDIDGIHFDYCRYADRGFDDEATWRSHGSANQSRDDWRRGNINRLVEDAYRRLTAIRPTLIVGSAPIGIYRSLPTAKGWEGRNAIFQDSRAWLAGGYHDYVVPQIYWGLTRNGSRIDFEALVRDWHEGSSGRHVYPGVAAYKEDIKPQLAAHVDAARAQGGQGVVFFRYEHIRGEGFAGRFSALSWPPALAWKDRVPPNPVRNLRFDLTTEGMRISWDEPLAAADGETAQWYAIVERRSDGSRRLLDVVPSQRTDARIAAGMENITVLAMDRARNESAAPDELPLIAAAARPAPRLRLNEARMCSPVAVNDELVLLGYELPHGMQVRLRLLNEDGAEIAVLLDGFVAEGLHVLGLEMDLLEEEVATCVLEAGDERIVVPFMIAQR